MTIPTAAIPAGATGVITIDLGQLAANWRALARLVGPSECGAVVKANAYGLGASRIIPALAAAGCRTFFVATAAEAAETRTLTDGDIVVLDGLVAGSGAALVAAGAIPALASLDEVREWAALASASGRSLPAALHLDSGLSRLGLSAAEVDQLAADPALLARLDLRLVMSHLACADDPAAEKNAAQRARFEALRARLPKARASLAASDGLMLGAPFHYDLVRPGYALYGGQAFRGGATPVGPVVQLAARILQVRDVAAGESVGYSAAWRAARGSRIAIVAAGYDDGIPRALSAAPGDAPAMVSVGGAKAPIVGRVSMDLITVDVTDISPAPQRGDLALFIGPGLTIEAMGARAGTIGYEVLVRLGRRFARVYVGDA